MKYTCEYCGTTYTALEDASKCEENHKLTIEKNKELAKQKKERRVEMANACKYLFDLANKYESDYGERAPLDEDLVKAIVKVYSFPYVLSSIM